MINGTYLIYVSLVTLTSVLAIAAIDFHVNESVSQNYYNKMTVSGCIISYNNISKPEIMDVPDQHLYLVKTDYGSYLNIEYIAYPPSPLGETAREKITLDFINDTILIGNYIEAHGTYSNETNTLKVEYDGDYIITDVKDKCF